MIDPKPARRIKDPNAGRRKCFLVEGKCRICKWSTALVSRHHLLKRSQGGDDVDDNLVPLCGWGTTGCHGAVERREPKALAALRQALTEPEIAYLLGKRGQDWLDRIYPKEEV